MITEERIRKIQGYKTWSTKRKVDELLKEDAWMYTNLGIDSTVTEKKKVKSVSRKIYKAISVISPLDGYILEAHMNEKDLTEKCDIIFVVGSENSSNSNRLKEIATRAGVPAYLLDCADDLDVKWLSNKKNIGLTAGASAPEVLVQSIINKLKGFGALNIINAEGVQENITFKIPKELAIKN